jgi:hypothetical protein
MGQEDCVDNVLGIKDEAIEPLDWMCAANRLVEIREASLKNNRDGSRPLHLAEAYQMVRIARTKTASPFSTELENFAPAASKSW